MTAFRRMDVSSFLARGQQRVANPANPANVVVASTDPAGTVPTAGAPAASAQGTPQEGHAKPTPEFMCTPAEPESQQGGVLPVASTPEQDQATAKDHAQSPQLGLLLLYKQYLALPETLNERHLPLAPPHSLSDAEFDEALIEFRSAIDEQFRRKIIPTRREPGRDIFPDTHTSGSPEAEEEYQP